MAYQIRTEKGIPVKKQGTNILAMDTAIEIKELDELNKTFIAVASTEDEDRDKDIVRQAGWKLTNFKKNPIVPWSHNYYGVPIAKSLRTWVDNDKAKGPRLLFKPKFDEGDDDSMKIFNKYKNGFLTSFSVGFRGIKSESRDENDPWWGGREFLQQELLEISAVAVPANPNASTRLNYFGNENPDNLIQMGYPEVFAKTKQGLFYPVADIAVYSQPKEFEVAKGVIGINAVSLDDEVKAAGPVAYVFDSELFDDKSANEWIKENATTKWEIKYFDLKAGKNGDFSLECIKAEDDIQHFETSIDFDSDDLSDKDADTDIQLEDQIDDNESKNIETDEDEISNDEDDSKSANNDSDEDKSKGEGNDTETDKNISDTENVSDTVTISVKRIIEVVTTIKDYEGNVIDTSAEIIASNREFKTVDEYTDHKSNQLISMLKNEIGELKVLIEDLSKEKTVANVTEIPDNDSNLDGKDGDSQETTTKDDDEIELDESLIKTSPGINDKTNSDDIIELDDSLLEESKSDAKKAVTETLVEKLRKGLKDAFSGASGKID